MKMVYCMYVCMYVTTFHIHTYIHTPGHADRLHLCMYTFTDRQTDSKKGKKKSQYLTRFNSQCCHTLTAEIRVTGRERERVREMN